MKLRLFWATFALFLTPTIAFSQVATPPATGELSPKIAQILAVPALRHAMVGVMVKSLDNGHILYAQNPDVSLMPASNQKLLTAWAALSELGPDFRYQTTVSGDGKVQADGTLTGNLYLWGNGDPSLTRKDLQELAKALKAQGVRRFSGGINTEAWVFDNKPLGEGWQSDDEAAGYSPQVSALNCDGNVVTVTIKPGKGYGEKAVVTVDGLDGLGFVTVDNRAVTVPESKKATAQITVDRTRGRNEIVVTGTIPFGAKEETETVTIENPARYAATLFYQACIKVGIQMPSPPQHFIGAGFTTATTTQLGSHQSAPLSELLRSFLQPSDNLTGECLLKTLGSRKGKAGSSAEGAKVIRALLAKQNISDAGLYIADGSGLSRQNLLTARFLIDLLTAIDKSDPKTRDIFVSALPQSGVSGTLRNRFKGTAGETRVHAKTGTLFGVSSLSGFVTAPTGERFAFAILMNHWSASGRASDARAAQDAIVLAVLGASPTLPAPVQPAPPASNSVP